LQNKNEQAVGIEKINFYFFPQSLHMLVNQFSFFWRYEAWTLSWVVEHLQSYWKQISQFYGTCV